MQRSTKHAPLDESGDSTNDAPVVFVVDANVRVRDALERLVSRAGWKARTFALAEAFLAFPRAPVPSCLVLDLTPPDISGLELQRRIAGQPEVPIIFMSALQDVAMTVRAMKAGAIEFLTKPLAAEAVLGAIRHGLDASRVLLARRSETEGLRAHYGSLSRREKEVMELVVAGFLNKQVGEQLGIAENSVKPLRGKLMRKMEAGSLPDLVRMAVKLGVVPAALQSWASETHRLSPRQNAS